MNLKSLCFTTLIAVAATACGTGTDCDVYYRDKDGDGYGDHDHSKFVCSQPKNYVRNDQDCDDKDENAKPGTFDGDLVVDGANDAAVADFVAACPGTVAGNITIINTDREDVDFLRSVETVEGTLTLSNNKALSDLRPLQNLKSVGGIVLSITPGLRDLEELDRLEQAGSVRLNLRLTDEENSLDVLSDVTGIRDLALNVVGINNFLGLPELTALEGDLLLGGPSINSLEGVTGIQSVGGSFTITNFRNDVDFTTMAVTEVGNFLRVNENDGLRTLSLPNLTSIGRLDVNNNGSLTTLDLSATTSVTDIAFNSNAVLDTFDAGFTTATDLDLTNMPALTSVAGLSDLADVTLEGFIVRNTGLTSLVGLEGVTSITGGGQIVGNPDLPALTGLDNLADIGGLLQIVNNASLGDLTGFGSLQSAGLELSDNGAMTSLNGADSLASVGTLTISGNLGLTSLDGVETLLVADTILVENNGNLTSIAGLNNLTSANSATFRNNPALSEADVDAWAELVGEKNIGTFVNEDNAP